MVSILHLEDDPTDSELLRSRLESAGVTCHLERVETEEAFSTALERGGFDVVIADYDLPTFDGVLGLQIARRVRPDVPFIFFTGALGEERAVESLRAGATDYVLKQRPARLVASVLRALGETEEHRMRRMAEEALAASQQRYQRVVDGSPAIIYSCAVADLVPTFISENIRIQLGYAPESFVGNRTFWESVVHDDDATHVSIHLRALARGETSVCEYRVRHADGSWRWIRDEARVVPRVDDQPPEIIGTWIDVTDKKTTEELQAEFRERMFRLSKMEAVGTLAGGIAHDFNNILSVVLSFCTVAERSRENPERFASAVATIRQAVQRGADLARQILTFARRSSTQLGPVDLNQLIREIVKMSRETFPRTILFSTSLAEDLPLLVADASQLHEAILNLCLNARDALPAGGTIRLETTLVPTATARERIPSARAPRYVSLVVADDGTGMPEEVRSRAFEPFFTTKKEQGTGLGLAVVHGVVESLGGSVECQSEPGRGTRFQLLLPVADHVKPEVSTPVQPVDLEGSETVLLVEDEEDLLPFLQAALEGHGYRVLVARNGQEAMERFARFQDTIQVVVTDNGLPGAAGSDLFHEFRRRKPSIPLILASGFLQPEALDELRRAGLSHFLQKPYREIDLLRAVRGALDGAPVR